MAPIGRSAQWQWLSHGLRCAAPEGHSPSALGSLKSPFEAVAGEFPAEILETYCGSKRAVRPNSAENASRLELELRLPSRLVVAAGQRTIGSVASTVSGCPR